MRRAGIKRVDGRVLVDTSLFPDQGAEGGTGVIVSPIVVNDNLVDVTVTPGARPGDPVSISVSPQTPYVRFVNRATTGRRKSDATIDLSADARDAAGRHTVTITGSQPVGPSVLYAYRVPEPAAFAQAAFDVALNDAGVRVEQPASLQSVAAPSPASYVPANLVAQHVSPPLSEDAYITLKVSDNLHAALMPYLWAVYLAHAKSDYLKAGFALEARLLSGAGLDVDEAAQQDGEGEQRLLHAGFHGAVSRMGANAIVVRCAASRVADHGGRRYARKYPARVAGPRQGLRQDRDRRQHELSQQRRDLEKGLAGYITTRGGRHVAFAFYIGAMNGPHDEDTGKVAGQILGAMAAATYESL